MRRRPAVLVVPAQALAIVAVTLGAGAVGGVVWEHLWTPPEGQVQQGAWGVYSEAALRADFAGVGLFVLVAVVAGLLVGVLSALILDRAELVSLLVLAVAALAAGWVMWKVGVHRGPPDPRALAPSLADGTRLPGSLRLHSRVPFVSMPLGALVGYVFALVAVPKRRAEPSPKDTAAGPHGDPHPGPDGGPSPGPYAGPAQGVADPAFPGRAGG